MAKLIILQVCLIFVAYILYRVVTSQLRERRFKAFAEQHGCLPAPDESRSLIGRLRNFNRLLKMRQTGEDFFDDILRPDFEKHPTFQARALEGTKVLTTTDPANLQAMLATQFDDFEMGELRHKQLGVILGKSIFTSDGAFWAHSRALFRPVFTRDNINDLDSTEKAARAFIAAIGAADDGGWTRNVELQPLFYNFTLDTASDFLFGESLESQKARMLEENAATSDSSVSQAGSQQFRQDFEAVQKGLINRLRLSKLYWLSGSSEFRQAVQRVRNFTERYVTAAVEAARGAATDEKKDTFLRRLATQSQDIDELRNQTLALLLAGRDTTAGLLGFTLMRLALHPDIFEKLRGIVMKEFETGSPVDFAKLKGCRYLQHLFNEVSRLHPTVPLNGRVATKDTTLPLGGGPDGKSPVAVRKGQQVGYSVYFMHRRKDLWGEDALEFKPERWEQRFPAWQFLPFSGGPRICLGQQFALVEASYLLVRLLQQYDSIEPVDKAEMAKMRKGLGLTLWPADGVKVCLHEAKA